MDDTDGSSNAAPGARETEEDSKPPGIFWRIVGALSPTDSNEAEDEEDALGASPKSAHGIMNLRRMRVEDVSIPRSEIISVPDTITRDELVDVFRSSGMTRLPVYSGTPDTPVGMAHLKDFALMHGFNGGTTPFDMAKLLRPLLFVPPSMPIGVLLTKMQTERRHMALVIDEYGGVDGLVTIEDLIEQVIGDIEDEHDTDEGKFWKEEKAGCYLAQARTPLDEFEAEIGMQLTDDDTIDAEEIDTLGGLVFVLSGHVPARGEMVPHPSGVEFEVVDADPRRIKRLRVRMPGSPGTAAASASAAAKVVAGTGHA